MRNARTAAILGLSFLATGGTWLATNPHNAVIVAMVVLAVMCLATTDFD